MASYMDIAESPLLYGLVITGILTMMIFVVIFLRKSWIRALELGYTKKQLMDVVKSSVTFSIVPSISIVVGMITLVLVVGRPWAQWRLSVIGSVTYELMASEMAILSAGLSKEGISEATGMDFTLVLYVMSICILGGITSSLFIAKKIQNGSVQRNKKDSKWGAVANSTFMLTLIVVFVIPMLFEGIVTVLVMLTSAVTAIVLTLLEKKLKLVWLNNFILAICLIVAMLSSILWTNLI